MRKEDMSVGILLGEAVGIVCLLLYVGLQIYCGILYGANATVIFSNVAMLLLVYISLSMLEVYPEKVNRLEEEVCTGDVRRYTIHMLLWIKLIFTLSMLFAGICDLIGTEVDGAYSLLAVGAILALAIGYEVKIFRILKKKNDE